MAFRIIRNDITKVKADAIVTTANPEVAIGDGVDAKYIIHASCPPWIDGFHQEEVLLRQCYDKALKLAYRHRCKTIAFPLLSTGTYGFPRELELQIALESFTAFLLKHEIEIILVVFGETDTKLSGNLFNDVREYVDNSYVKHTLLKEYRHDDIPTENTRNEINSEDKPKFDTIPKPSASYSRHSETISEQKISYKEKTPECPPLPSILSSPKLNLDIPETGSFGEYLQQMINKKGMKNSEVYTAANITKQYFSKLLKGKVAPSKTKILSLAVALRLNLDETVDFLRMSGYAFSPFSTIDKIFEYFIRNQIYDIYKIDIVLFDYGLPTLVNE